MSTTAGTTLTTTTMSSDQYHADVEIEPLPCPRPRIALRGRFPTAYYPKAYKDWREQFTQLLPPVSRQFTRGVSLSVTFRCTKPRTSTLTTPKGDIDNHLKSVMDSLTDHGVWADDKQVERVAASKRFAAPGETAGITLTVTETNG